MKQLPVVSEQVGAAVLHEFRASEGNAYLIEILERLERENPCLASFVSSFSIQQEDSVAVTTGALLLYRLIESQLEADNMNREFS